MATPTSASGQPTSFKTNVNRAKTKRWVEAKSYTYDGDDWGDVDDYDEYGGYDEPPPPIQARPTGLRQRGQSATQPPENSYGQQLYQSPVSQQPSHGGFGSHDQRQYGSREMTNPVPKQQNLQRVGSFETGDERIAFSAGMSQPVAFNETRPMYPTPHENQSFQGEQRSPGPHNAQGQPPNRRSMENHSRYSGKPPNDAPGVDQPRVASVGSRAQSMTSNASSLDFHNRRDFSPSAMPPPLQPRESPSPHNDPRQRPPRKSSLTQQSQPPLDFDPQPMPPHPVDTRTQSQSRERAGSSSSSKALPFVRPADIYKRMEEEREKVRQSQDSSRPSMDAILGKPSEPVSVDSNVDTDSGSRLKPTLDPVTERRSEYGFDGINVGNRSSGGHQVDEDDKPRTTSKKFDIKKPSQSAGPQHPRLSTRLELPDPTRLSGFGEDFGDSFMGSHDTFGQFSNDPAANESEESGDAKGASELQHQPSKGFKSAVHQAFDTAQDQVPPTPSSTADSSIGRSASGGTSTVSPIMSRGPSAIDRDRGAELPSIDDVTTPTLDEETTKSRSRQQSAGSFGTLTRPSAVEDSAAESEESPPPGLKIGHRRESNPPSPDNSPAKTPALASMSHLRHPQQVDFAETTPTPTDSVPSASNSFREGGESAKSDIQDITEPPAKAPVRATQATSAQPTFIDSPTSPAQSVLRQRTDSSGSGRVKNLADKFESNSRPESTHSNTTPRASVLGLGPSGTHDLAPPRPLNERVESFRPQLPGGWESTASIAPASSPTRKRFSAVSNLNEPEGTGTAPPPLTQAKDASSSAFSAAAEAGSALAGALVAAVGMDEGPHSKDQPPQAASGRDRSVSTNTVVHPEASRPPMIGLPGDNSNAPSPLPKDKPHQLGGEAAASEYFPKAADKGHDSTLRRDSDEPKQLSSLPALSTNMDQQYESDRLRREIVKDLGPDMPSEPTTAESDSPYQASSKYPTNNTVRSTDGENAALPNEYDSYWNDDSDNASTTSSRERGQMVNEITVQPEQGAPTFQEPLETPETKPSAPALPQAAPQSTQSQSHTLEHRFSWEKPLADLSPSSPPPSKSAAPTENAREIPPSDFLKQNVYPQEKAAEPRGMLSSPAASVEDPSPQGPAGGLNDGQPREKELAAMPTFTSGDHRSDVTDADQRFPRSAQSGAMLPEKNPPLTSDQTEALENTTSGREAKSASQEMPASMNDPPQIPQVQLGELPPPPAASAQPKLPAFREIMALKTPAERIRVFKETQKQFAEMNTGLSHWLAVASATMPEHSDIVSTGGRTGVVGPGHKPSPSKSRLAGFMTSGQSGQPYYQQYLDASPSSSTPGGGLPSSTTGGGSSQGLSPPGGSGGKISGQQVQAKSKELLRGAGVFGGKANVAAKGLFSKGKSKLRDASGSKKV